MGNSTFSISVTDPELYNIFPFFSLHSIDENRLPKFLLTPGPEHVGEYFVRCEAVELYTFEHFSLSGLVNIKITEDTAEDAELGEEFAEQAA